MTYQPKSYRKFLATSVAAAMVATVAAPMVLANFDDVAEGSYYSDAVDYLVEKEVLEGYPDGSFQPSAGVTRAEAAKILVETLGLEVETEVELGFTDTKDDAWYSGSVAALVKADIVGGFPDGTFAPSKTITRAELAKMVVEANKLVQDPNVEIPFTDTVTGAWYEDSVNTLYSLGIVNGMTGTSFAPNSTVTRAQAAVFVHRTEVEAVRLEVEKIVVDLMVESVSAINLVEVEVVFNQAVDKTTAETAANYVITTTGTAATPVATLQPDGKTVRLLLTNPATQQETVKITVADVEDLDGNKLASVDFEDVVFFDASIPTVNSIELVGPQSFTATFSEALGATMPTVLVDNGVYGASYSSISADRRVVTFNLSAKLADGNYTVKISGAKDAAGYTIVPTTFTLGYVEDMATPTVAVDKADQLKVTFKFDKKVKNVTTANFYHTFTGWNPIAVQNVDTSAIASGDFVDTVVAVFATSATSGHPLVAGNNVVGVVDGATGSELQDLWGNKIAASTVFTVPVSADTIAPTVTKVEATQENSLEVTFDEAVMGATTAANYVVYDKDGEEVTTSKTATYSDKVATLNFASDLASGNYTVKVQNITDSSIYANKIVAQTVAFAITDLTAPASISAEYVVSGSKYIVYVTYPELMDTATTLVKANYQINGVALAAADTVEVFGDSSKVKITTANNPAGQVVTVKSVKDVAGNAVGQFTTLASGNLTTASAPVATKIKTTSLNTIEVTFNKHLSAAPAASFSVETGLATGAAGVGTTVAAATYVNNSDLTSTVTLILAGDENLASEGDTSVKVNILDTNVKSFTGAAMVIAADVNTGTVTDGVAPALFATTPINTVDSNTDGFIDQVTVKYTENIDTASVSKYTYTVAGYDVVSAASSGSVVTLTLTPKTTSDTGATPEVTQVLSISDSSANKLDSVVAKAATDTAGPVMVSAKALSATELEITYSENVSTTTAGATDWVYDADGVGAGVAAVTASVAATDGSSNKIVLTLPGGTFVTGTAVAAGTITYTQAANDTDDGVTATAGNAAATAQTITGVTSGF